MPLDHPLAFNKRHDHKTYNQLIWVLIYFSSFQDLFVNKLLNGEVLKILLSNAKTAYSIRGSPTPMHPPRSLPWTCPICHSAYVLVLLVPVTTLSKPRYLLLHVPALFYNPVRVWCVSYSRERHGENYDVRIDSPTAR